MAEVGEGGGVNRVQEQRPCPDAALRARQREAVFELRQGDATAGEAVRRKPAEHADCPRTKIEDGGVRPAPTENEGAACDLITPRCASGKAAGHDVMAAESVCEETKVACDRR